MAAMHSLMSARREKVGKRTARRRKGWWKSGEIKIKAQPDNNTTIIQIIIQNLSRKKTETDWEW